MIPLEKGKPTHSSDSGLENSMDCIAHGVTKTQTQPSDFHSLRSLTPKTLAASLKRDS